MVKPCVRDPEAAAAFVDERIPSIRPDRSCLLVAVSGIDGSGKGTVSQRIADRLQASGRKVARIGLDPWHHPASVRFAARDPAGHFYRNAFRFDDLFDLVDPLHRTGWIDRSVTLIDPATDLTRLETVRHRDVEIILLEGIFLLKRELRARYDAAVWIDCAFETALRRALTRNQEGLSRERLERDYPTIYFPAQELHLERDDPAGHADLIFDNR